MSLALQALTFEHFGPFRARQTVPLDDQGLVLVRGENRVSSAMDSNGCGKTALFDALAWALFGETLRGRRGEDVACRFTKESCEVSVSFAVDAHEVAVTRRARPSVLLLSGEDKALAMRELQPRIEHWLGFGFRTFKNAVVFGQGAFDRFAQADQGDQLRMLDEIQGLDLRAALDRAKHWRDDAAQRAATCEGVVLDLRTRLQEHQTQVRALELAEHQYAARKRERLDALEGEVLQWSEQLDAADAARKALKPDRALLAQLQGQVAAWTLAVKHQVSASQAHAAAQGTLRAAQQQVEALESRLQALIKAGRCATCRAPTSEATVRQGFKEEQVRMRTAVDAAQQHEAETKAALRQADAVVAKFLGGLEQQVGALTTRTSPAYETEVGNRRTLAQARLDEARRVLDATKRERFEGAAALAALRVALDSLLAEVEGHETQVIRAQSTLEVADYWVEAFGDRGIRSLMFDSLAPFLNARLTQHLGALAGGEVGVVVSAQSLLKSGASKERMSITPTWTWGGQGRGTSSHGQDRRIDLALFAALQDLAESRSARPFPCKIYDEPLDALDTRGKELAVEWVRREARTRGTVFLVTHSRELEDLVRPDHVWTIVMARDGAHVEVA